MATLTMFMYTYGLSMDACVAWSSAEHAAAAACIGAANVRAVYRCAALLGPRPALGLGLKNIGPYKINVIW